jgi:glycosyltransferase involved in cell wall biosynthesis
MPPHAVVARTIPVSTVIPTRNRGKALRATLESLAAQSVQPKQIVIVDASDTRETQTLCEGSIQELQSDITYINARTKGAALQRNEGMVACHHDLILFMDDDLLFERECIERLYEALQSNPELGGVNAMITNQKYQMPGKVSLLLYKFLHGVYLPSYAGKCLGPVVNLLPEDREDLPEVVSVEWLNTTCALYKREALPNPPFPSFFTGYSLFEDVTVSSIVGRKWKLANARTARIYHDSQPGDHKKSMTELSKMELVNRYYVMTRVLHRSGGRDMIKLVITEAYKVCSYLQSFDGLKKLPAVLLGKCKGVVEIINLPHGIEVI